MPVPHRLSNALRKNLNTQSLDFQVDQQQNELKEQVQLLMQKKQKKLKESPKKAWNGLKENLLQKSIEERSCTVDSFLNEISPLCQDRDKYEVALCVYTILNMPCFMHISQMGKAKEANSLYKQSALQHFTTVFPLLDRDLFDSLFGIVCEFQKWIKENSEVDSNTTSMKVSTLKKYSFVNDAKRDLKPLRPSTSTHFRNSSIRKKKLLLKEKKENSQERQQSQKTSLLLKHLNDDQSHYDDGDAQEFSSKDFLGDFDSNWLVRRCALFLSQNQTLPYTTEDLALIVIKLLLNNSDAEIQGILIDMLGFDSMEFIGDVFEKLESIVRVTNIALDRVRTYTDNLQEREVVNPTNAIVGVIVQTNAEKEEIKRQRKIARKQQQKQANNKDSNEDYELRCALGLDEEFNAKFVQDHKTINRSLLKGAQQVQYPHVYDARAAGADIAASIGGTKLRLPANCIRDSAYLYESIKIPAPVAAPIRETERRIKITEFGPVAQIPFKGYESLNRIQSIIYPAAYQSNQNLLICAPTGAGKTNVALMTIVREIEKNTVNGVVQLDNFKIVYVAPMKALAAEMTENFGKRLAPLGISVRELTGDMQLSKNEIKKTQMLVTTPEKWDVVTRKSVGDAELSQLVRLLILDEVHLLHDDRGAVIESLVARTLRQVESSQSMIRIVGLSATLPNYLDVAQFLRVNCQTGLFFFDGRFRPVPMTQEFVGVKCSKSMLKETLNVVCFDKIVEHVRNGDQVMIFVHSRNDTSKTAEAMLEIAMKKNLEGLFLSDVDDSMPRKQLGKSPNRSLQWLGPKGFGIHHAGMLRTDRNLVEKLFAQGFLRVLCCTSTLAWGVNLPAHAVVIKGTNVYDSKAGGFRDLGVLDVQQIFGRAGRPQFDTFGEAYILTDHSKLNHYLTVMTTQTPIESQFIKGLADHLNAEVTLGTVANVSEAIKWLSYTFLFVRMQKNPHAYGIKWDRSQTDPFLEEQRKEIIHAAANRIDEAQMVRYNTRTGYISSTDLGRIASHFYLKTESVMEFNERFRDDMDVAQIMALVSGFSEFSNIQLREDETNELTDLSEEKVLDIIGGPDNPAGKVNSLLQAHISRRRCDTFSLISDMAYVAQNSARILRALFELSLRRSQPIAKEFLKLVKNVDKKQWEFESPLRQFDDKVKYELISKLEAKNIRLPEMREMSADDLGHLVRHVKAGATLKEFASHIPHLEITSKVQPITRSVLRVELEITPKFRWSDKWNGAVEPWWIMIEDTETQHLYHCENFLIHKKDAGKSQELIFTVPIFEPYPPQYQIHAVSDRWIGAQVEEVLELNLLVLPDQHAPHTNLLDLKPLPVSALQNQGYQAMYKFSHFNPVQTQFFHSIYHDDVNILVGAPTGSGKTVAAELALFRMFNTQPGKKAVYIAPLKALVRERVKNWTLRLLKHTGKRLVELTGDVAPDISAIQSADLIITTPEKWDGISRSWQSRSYVKDVVLIIIDEIHLLGEERGPVLEVIVSRTNYISAHTDHKIRVVGLSTALANAHDLAYWLGIDGVNGLYNFRPSVRPVPLEVHIEGFPGKNYCPRMATMNKPTYAAMRTYSNDQPCLVFVSSRRQTRLTALDLISFSVADDLSKQFIKMSEEELENELLAVVDPHLKHCLSFGIGMHHAGLVPSDRDVVERLFFEQKILVLIATSTLAWGVNLPAHLVVVKGTEFFDPKTKRYKDFPVTDVLQMMGRAGRPQFDDSATAVILVHDIKKHFYKKFLYEPFPVESQLLDVLTDHMNAEIVSGTITGKQSAIDFLTWTYFFHRITKNPSFYGLEGLEQDQINQFLSDIVQNNLSDLADCHCVEIDGDDVEPTTLGSIASYYYLKYNTIGDLHYKLQDDLGIEELLEAMTEAHEYDEIPVRHNEELLNETLSENEAILFKPQKFLMDSPNVKANLLLQARFGRCALPITDYETDTKTVLDQAVRVLQAMIDVSGDQGHFNTCVRLMKLLQMVIQGRWSHEDSLLTIPGVQEHHLNKFPALKKSENHNSDLLEDNHTYQLAKICSQVDARQFMERFDSRIGKTIYNYVKKLPLVEMKARVKKVDHNKALLFDTDYALEIGLTNTNPESSGTTAAYNWPRPIPVQWFILLRCKQNNELLALKRIKYFHRKMTTTLDFYTPLSEEIQSGQITLELSLVSDCFLGMDMNVEFNYAIED